MSSHPPQRPGAPRRPPGSLGKPSDDARADDLARDTQTWTLLVILSWFMGMMWIAGPVAWLRSTQIAQRHRRLGMPITAQLNTLRLLAMTTTIVVLVGFASVCAVVIVSVVHSLLQGPRHF